MFLNINSLTVFQETGLESNCTACTSEQSSRFVIKLKPYLTSVIRSNHQFSETQQANAAAGCLKKENCTSAQAISEQEVNLVVHQP